jgi:DnaJ domain
MAGGDLGSPGRMYRNTILKPVECDLKQLPLGAVEAFVLSEIDGRMTLEEVATIAGLEFAETAQIVERLVELGAVEVAGETRASKRLSLRAGKKSTKAPPALRSQRPSAPQKSARPQTTHSSARPQTTHSSARPQTTHSSARPQTTHSSARPQTTHSSARAERRSSRPMPSRSIQVRAAAPVDDVTCDIDDAARARISTLAAKLDRLDHYALLDVDRDADKKAVKRAYFALAATFHPDRFFGKKLGPVRVPLERIFDRLTVAHDTLTRREERAAYDATLPAARPRSTPPAPKGPTPSRAPPSRSLSIVPRKSSRKMKAVTAPPIASPEPSPPPLPLALPALPAATAPAPAAPRIFPPAADRAPPTSDASLRRLYSSAKHSEVQRRVDIFLGAAEEAMKKDDVIGAANNYRLALQNTEDPEVRRKLEAIEEAAKSRHYDQSLNRARAAEKAERWLDAASYFAKANSARPDAGLAERAAHALRMSGGDLHRAAELAQQAILADPKNAGYHMTLAEIYLAAKLFTRAAGEAARALEIAPSDRRAKELAAALPKKKT